MCLCAQQCPTPCSPTGCSPPGSSVLGISQASLPFPPPEDLPHSGTKPTSLMSPALTGVFFTAWAIREAPEGQAGIAENKALFPTSGERSARFVVVVALGWWCALNGPSVLCCVYKGGRDSPAGNLGETPGVWCGESRGDSWSTGPSSYWSQRDKLPFYKYKYKYKYKYFLKPVIYHTKKVFFPLPMITLYK